MDFPKNCDKFGLFDCTVAVDVLRRGVRIVKNISAWSWRSCARSSRTAAVSRRKRTVAYIWESGRRLWTLTITTVNMYTGADPGFSKAGGWWQKGHIASLKKVARQSISDSHDVTRWQNGTQPTNDSTILTQTIGTQLFIIPSWSYRVIVRMIRIEQSYYTNGTVILNELNSHIMYFWTLKRTKGENIGYINFDRNSQNSIL